MPTAKKSNVKATMRLDGYTRFDEIDQGGGLWTIIGYDDGAAAATKPPKKKNS